MKWMSFEREGQQSYGLELDENGQVIDLPDTCAALGWDKLPGSLLEAIEVSDQLVALSQRVLEKVNSNDIEGLIMYFVKDVKRLAPIPRPRKNVFCVGKNYADHVAEMGGDAIPEAPVVFTKAPNTVIGAGHPVQSHFDVTQELDYEGELAIVIGKKGKKITADEAMDYVFGYTIINDITARDLQRRHKQFFLGKSLDTSCPMGPNIVHRSLIEDPHKLSIQTWVNEEVRQNGNTEQLIFSIPTLISVMSAGMTLEPGDIIATGTPSGVGNGFKPPRFLKSGDVVEIQIEGVGTLTNRIE
jgi:2-keto-4-pentenoate hydratase/2-oxohepta-3-ene-1,7-dioic acid hydratase in catechol pathway